jgi:hypothetical protein
MSQSVIRSGHPDLVFSQLDRHHLMAAEQNVGSVDSS